jgi:hypothetical protein
MLTAKLLYRRKILLRGDESCLRQVNMYKSLPAELRSGYPRLLFAHQDPHQEHVAIGIEYQDAPNLRDLLLNLQVWVLGRRRRSRSRRRRRGG